MERTPQRPFHVSAYQGLPKTPGPARRSGFTAAAPEQVQPWIPGVTSPEGIVLVSGVAAAMASSGDAIIRAAQLVAAGLAFGITAAFPGGAAYMVSQVN